MRRNIEEKIISKTKHVEHVLRTAVGCNSEVIKLPLGGQVMPYFKDAKNVWHAVLINQYRIALKKNTLEAAGGIIDKGETPQEALSRELKEETGIKLNPLAITIVFNEYAAPSLLDASMFGGISKINADMVINKNRMVSGKNERTQVEIFDLKNLLKKREEGVIKIDLMTSRLLDEIAKAVGLLVKKY